MIVIHWRVIQECINNVDQAAGNVQMHTLDYTVSQKNCAKLFVSELCQISTNFDKFWQKDSKEAKIMRAALTFHLT